VRSLVGILLTAGALAGGVAPRLAQAQSARVRFDIDSVADSTFTFFVGHAHWMSPGRVGSVVDPARGDVLVAEFRVVQVTERVATAVITGQTTRLKATDDVVIAPPTHAFYIEPLFWIGAAAGIVVGLLIHVR
jgi:hypothetical protein